MVRTVSPHRTSRAAQRRDGRGEPGGAGEAAGPGDAAGLSCERRPGPRDGAAPPVSSGGRRPPVTPPRAGPAGVPWHSWCPHGLQLVRGEFMLFFSLLLLLFSKSPGHVSLLSAPGALRERRRTGRSPGPRGGVCVRGPGSACPCVPVPVCLSVCPCVRVPAAPPPPPPARLLLGAVLAFVAPQVPAQVPALHRV